MLVLSRRVGERILIGDKIAITVVRINGTTVRIGVEAPDDLPIFREELSNSPAATTADHETQRAAALNPIE